MAATNFNYLYSLIPPVAWSNTTQYQMQTYTTAGGAIDVKVPMVTDLSITYYLNGSSVPVLGTHPASDTAWSDISGGTGGLPNLTNGNIWIGNGSNIATARALSGGATVSNTGVITLGNTAVTSQLITGYVSGAGAVSATDTILQAIQKLNGNAAAINNGFVTGQALTGYTPTAGSISALSTILSAFQNLGFVTYAGIQGFSATGIAAGALTLNNGTSSLSSNLTLNATNVSLALNKTYKVIGIIDVTTASASGATLTITATNATVLATQGIAVGASATNQYVFLQAIVQTTATANPSVAVTASAVSGTVDIINDSSLQITSLVS